MDTELICLIALGVFLAILFIILIVMYFKDLKHNKKIKDLEKTIELKEKYDELLDYVKKDEVVVTNVKIQKLFELMDLLDYDKGETGSGLMDTL